VFLHALDLDRPHVGGVSWGGGLALELYRRHPDLPRSLVLASAYAGWAGSLPAEVVAERLERALGEAELPPEQWVPGYLPGLFSDSVAAEVVEEALAMMLAARPAGMRPMVQGFAEADLREVLAGIQVATLLLYGDADRRSPLEVVARDLHARISGSRLVVLPGVGHQIDMEAPDRFNAEVRGFLRSVQHRAG
jgi:pimeloyl-ACP methyl ester carboxylesterase